MNFVHQVGNWLRSNWERLTAQTFRLFQCHTKMYVVMPVPYIETQVAIKKYTLFLASR